MAIELSRWHRSIVLDLANQLELVLPFEWRAQRQHFVERRAERIEVALGRFEIPRRRSGAM